MSRPSAIALPLPDAELGGDVEQLVDAVRACVAGAVGRRTETQAAHRVEEVLLQLGGALTVAPVPDPHEVAALRQAGDRVERPRVRGLVPCPRPLGPAALEVEVPDHLAEGEDA